MLFEHRGWRFAAGFSLAVAAAAAGGSAMHPAAAAAVLAAAQSAVTCSVTGTSACVSGTDTSSGIGVYGTSKSGTGVRGLSQSNNGLKATSTSGDGVLGGTTSGVAGVEGTNVSGYGVYGHTTGSGGYGIFGASVSGYGVLGETTSGEGIGVAGFVGGSATGVYGSSTSGNGVDAQSGTGTGISAGSDSGTAVYATSDSGYAVNANTSAGSADAVYARNSNGNAADFGGSYIGLVSRTPAGGFPFVATDPTGANNLFYVDGSGNVSYKGGLFHLSVIRGGATARSFNPNSTQPTVEDTGTAQLVAGAAVVRLDPTFAASIDQTTAYRVFVTPGGDTHGLYVTGKTPNGFIVRESEAGRSTVSFDYRIVATALGQTGAHMAVVNSAASIGAPSAIAAAQPRPPAHGPMAVIIPRTPSP